LTLRARSPTADGGGRLELHGAPIQIGRGTLERDRHICAFVDSAADEYGLLLPFVADGLGQGERAVHVVDPARRTEHVQRLEAAGIDVRGGMARGQIEILDWSEAHLHGGRFDPAGMTARLKSIFSEGRHAGYARTRLVAHMGWALEGCPGVERLIDYEIAVDRFLHGLPDPVVCTYDRTRITAAFAMDVFAAHRVGVVTGGLRRNPLFGSPRPRGRAGDAVPLLRRRYLAALLAGSVNDAIEIVVEEGQWLDVPLPSLYLHVVQAAQYAIGRLWGEGRISIADEHVATEASRLTVAALRAHFTGQPRLGRSVAVACIEGERHDLGARIVADLLEMGGFDVRFLGADVPLAELIALVRDDPPDVLGLSATATANVPALRAAVGAVRAAVGERVALAAGGLAFASRPGLARELGVELHAPDAGALVRRLHHLFGFGSQTAPVPPVG
jgi:methanogenic corrinoid protein MtbC1